MLGGARGGRPLGWPRFALLAVLAAALSAIAACGGGATTARTASVAHHVSSQDRTWIDQMHRADLAEMETGPLAQGDGGSAAIRAAGAALVADHTAFDLKLVRVAQSVGVALPHHMSVTESETGDRLSQESGPLFDHDFTASMMSAHQTMIAATKVEVAHGSSPAVVALAREALPMLEKHLRLLQAAAPTG